MDVHSYHKRRSEIAGLPWHPYKAPKEHHLLLDRRRFHYLEWGEAGQPLYVFLHGGSQNAWTWDTVCQHLARDHHCVALDLRGHGESEWAYDQDYRVAAFVSDLAQFLDRMPEKPVLVGMSLGGLTALNYALEHSHILSGLVCVDVAPNATVSAAKPIREFVSEGFKLTRFEDFVDAAARFNTRRQKELLAFSMRRSLRRLVSGHHTWKTDPQMRHAVDAFAVNMSDIAGQVHKITCPTLLVRGGDSAVVSQAQADAFVASLPDGRSCTVPNAGHSVQGDNPKGLIAALKDFEAVLPPRRQRSGGVDQQ